MRKRLLQGFSVILLISLAFNIVPTIQPAEGDGWPASETILAYQGFAAIVDGIITEGDGWDQAIPVTCTNTIGEVTVRAKHDGTNLYILCESKDISNWIGSIYFEDDGLSPDQSLDYENDECKSIVSEDYTDGIRDSFWSDGWIVEVLSDVDGGVEASESSSLQITEWWLPLSTGSLTDINVTSDEILGFYASPGFSYDPTLWWNLLIRYSDAPVDTQDPIADAGPDISVAVGDTAYFDSSESSDDKGILNFSWHFTVNDTSWVEYGPFVEYNFTVVGEFFVILLIKDYGGNSAMDTITVTVTVPVVEPFVNVTYSHYTFTGDINATDTLEYGEYAIYEFIEGTKSVEISASVITPMAYANFFVFSESQLSSFQDNDTSQLNYTLADKASRSFRYSINSSEKLYLVVDNTLSSSSRVDGLTPITYHIEIVDSSVIEDETSLDNFIFWEFLGIIILIFILGIYLIIRLRGAK